MSKKQNYAIFTYRLYKDEGYKEGEYISHYVCSYSLLKACEYMEDYVKDSDTDCYFTSVIHEFADGSKFYIKFEKDDEFFHFVEEVYYAELDDYEEWLRSYNKERTEQGLPASNGESSEITTEGY